MSGITYEIKNIVVQVPIENIRHYLNDEEIFVTEIIINKLGEIIKYYNKYNKTYMMYHFRNSAPIEEHTYRKLDDTYYIDIKYTPNKNTIIKERKQ